MGCEVAGMGIKFKTVYCQNNSVKQVAAAAQSSRHGFGRALSLASLSSVVYLVMCPAYIRPSPPSHAVIFVNSLLLSLSLSVSPIISTIHVFLTRSPTARRPSLVPLNQNQNQKTAATSWFSDRRPPCPQTVVPRVVKHIVIGHPARIPGPSILSLSQADKQVS
jgi:hypothetical protein